MDKLKELYMKLPEAFRDLPNAVQVGIAVIVVVSILAVFA